MRITDPLQLSAGMEIYTVCSFGGCGHNHHCALDKFEILTVPVNSKNAGKTFIKLLGLDSLRLAIGGKWEQGSLYKAGKTIESSMKDMGIIQNTYNEHQTFDSLIEAGNYAQSYFNLPTTGTTPDTQRSSDVCDYDRAMKVVGV